MARDDGWMDGVLAGETPTHPFEDRVGRGWVGRWGVGGRVAYFGDEEYGAERVDVGEGRGALCHLDGRNAERPDVRLAVVVRHLRIKRKSLLGVLGLIYYVKES